jgi:hypothetical protein
MAIHGDVRVADALASLNDDNVPAELIVVNTGAKSLHPILFDRLDQIVLIERATPSLPGLTRNLGLAEARAPIVAFLAADCLATGDWLAERLALHQAAPAVASAILPAPAPDGRVPLVAWASCLLLHARRLPFAPRDMVRRHGVSYARELFDRHGTFLETQRIAEDTEFNLRLADQPAWAPSIVTLHRYPATLSASLADAFRRGQHLHAWMRARRIPATSMSLRRAAGALWYGMALIGHAPKAQRRRLIAAAPFVWLLALAYAAGGLSRLGRSPRITAG